MAPLARVLVAEDDDAVRGVILRVLTQRGFDVLEARDMPAALEQWQEAERSMPIDLLITDHVMPGGNGHDLAVELWTRCSSLPVLFMSGYEDDWEAVRAPAPSVHLSKPFTTTKLLEHVDQLLRHVRSDTDPGAS